MIYRVAADLVVLIHAAFVLFVAVGGLLALRWRRAMWAHLPAVAWGVLIELAGCVCPLTPLENWLRLKGGGAGYAGGFVEHYVVPVLYPSGLTRGVQVALAGAVVALNLAVYYLVLRPRPGRTAG